MEKELRMKVASPLEIERIVLVLNLGILRAVRHGAMTVDDAMWYFLRPYVGLLVAEVGGREETRELIMECCELENVQSLIPDRLPAIVEQLELRNLELLASLPKKPTEYWLCPRLGPWSSLP